jgi:hypothetical protein
VEPVSRPGPPDVFALGALAYFVLATRPSAPDRIALRQRLQRENGLDLAADLPQVPAEVRGLVLKATRPTVSERLADVRSFLAQLADAERALAAPGGEAVDPLEAGPGAVIDGRFRLERRLHSQPQRRPARNAAATSTHAATATQSMNRASGSMNAR